MSIAATIVPGGGNVAAMDVDRATDDGFDRQLAAVQVAGIVTAVAAAAACAWSMSLTLRSRAAFLAAQAAGRDYMECGTQGAFVTLFALGLLGLASLLALLSLRSRGPRGPSYVLLMLLGALWVALGLF